MFRLDSLTCATKSNILSNVSLHPIPPISGIEIMVYYPLDEWNKQTHVLHEVSDPSIP
jgi:hypothetical protein